MWVTWSGAAASPLLATDTLSSPVLHRALRNEKAVFHARFVGGQAQLVDIGSSSFRRHSHRRRDCCNACLPHHCAPSARRASSRIEVALGRAMNAAALLGRGRAGLDRLIRGCRPPGLLAATYVDQYPGGETVRLVCASEYRKLECTAIAAAFGTVWIARLVFLRSCAGGGVLAVDFAPLAPSFAILCAGGCVLAVGFAPLAPSF